MRRKPRNTRSRPSSLLLKSPLHLVSYLIGGMSMARHVLAVYSAEMAFIHLGAGEEQGKSEEDAEHNDVVDREEV